jgi:hypothetical protein
MKPGCEPSRRFFAGEAGQEVGQRYVPGFEASPVLSPVGAVSLKGKR